MAFLGISKCANTSRKAIKANQIYLQEIAAFIIKKEAFRLPTFGAQECLY
jgi:hypothetical protein